MAVVAVEEAAEAALPAGAGEKEVAEEVRQRHKFPAKLGSHPAHTLLPELKRHRQSMAKEPGKPQTLELLMVNALHHRVPPAQVDSATPRR
jgi:hypothetical protein